LGRLVSLYFWSSWNDYSIYQLGRIVETTAKDSTDSVVLYVNGYDSNPERAREKLEEIAPGMMYYSIDDESLSRLGIDGFPAWIEIGTDGLLYQIDGETSFYWDWP